MQQYNSTSSCHKFYEFLLKRLCYLFVCSNLLLSSSLIANECQNIQCSKTQEAKNEVGNFHGKSGDQSLRVKKYFTTHGTKIYGPDNNIFEPRGVNIFPWHGSTSTADSIQNCWNFNLVRLHSWIFSSSSSQWKDHIVYIDEPLIFDPADTAFTSYDVHPLIDYYTSRKLVVVFDVHEKIGEFIEGNDLDNYLIFISDFAKKYKDNPYVWLDIHNEPGSYEGQISDFVKWRHEVLSILDTVKSIAPNMVVLISGTAWGQDTGPDWSEDLIVPEHSALLANQDILSMYSNTIATFHIYDQWVFGTERLKHFIDNLFATLNKPVIVGEYGSFNNVNTIKASESLHEVTSHYESGSLGRIVWSWDAYDSNDLTTSESGGGQFVDSCIAPGNLTALGKLVWQDNHR